MTDDEKTAQRISERFEIIHFLLIFIFKNFLSRYIEDGDDTSDATAG